jgi:hypothetical protein
LSIQSQPRVGDVRALATSAILGSVMGLAIGGAYLAGGLAHAPQTQQTQVAQAGSAALVAPSAAPAPFAVPATLNEQDGAKLIKVDAPILRAPEKLGLGPLSVLKSVAQPFKLHGALDQSRELECLTQAVYSEARGESPAGQAAVAQVILNRVRHPAFPKSVCGVVYQGCQFSFACNGGGRRHAEGAAWDRARQVATRAMDGYVMADVGTATHFHASRLGSTWSGGLRKVAQIGAHIFYRFAGSRGGAGMFSNDAPARAVYASLGPLPAGSGGKILTAVEHAAHAVGDGVRGAFSPSKVVLPTPVSKAIKTADKADDAPPAPTAVADVAPAPAS